MDKKESPIEKDLLSINKDKKDLNNDKNKMGVSSDKKEIDVNNVNNDKNKNKSKYDDHNEKLKAVLEEKLSKNPDLINQEEIFLISEGYHNHYYRPKTNTYCFDENEEGLKYMREREKEAKEQQRLSRLSYMSPYRGIVLELQSKRRTYPKGSFNNLIYKLIGNSIYGQVSMGLSGKTNYDIKTKSYVKVDAGELTNPILASYITGFTRAAVGELMHNVSLLKGSIISVTTDGFITDIADLERKIMENSIKIYGQTLFTVIPRSSSDLNLSKG